MAQTLAELKAENAAEEAAQLETKSSEVEEDTKAPKAEDETPETEAVEEETKEEDGDSESQESESEEAEIEDWQRTEEESTDSSNDKHFSNGDMAHVRRKFKGKLSDSKDEIEVLKAEIERIKASPQPVQSATDKPKPEDFLESDDPNEAYTDAVIEYKLNARTQVQSQEAQQKASHDSLERAVDNHYDRVDMLVKNSKGRISAEAYQANDRKVRLAINAVNPGMGDFHTDTLISVMGDASDKIMWHLAVNSGKLEKLTSLLREDPRGLKASQYIGTLENIVNKKPAKTSRAPAPATQINGDAPVTNVSVTAKKLQKKYNDSHKQGNSQAAFNARREAKKAGVDISNW